MTTDYSAAVAHLCAVDARLASVIERIGPPQLGREADAWRALSSSIIGQQISVHAARAIRGRFALLAPDGDYPTPAHLLDLEDETLRGAGLSRGKVLSLRDLAAHLADNRINAASFVEMEDEDIIQALLPVRGIGRWTAEMFLLFSLGRADVWAVDDLGLRNALWRLYELKERPKAAVMQQIAAPWRPFRGVASWYLWRFLDNEPK